MSFDVPGLCEIRVPTYRRPKLLRRALSSILEQTYSRWRCMVFDDCPDGSARSIVEGVGDQRLEYRRNSKQLGATGNIDQSFTREPLMGGEYAFILEDDNYLLPNHIEISVDILRRNKLKVAFCNQYCEVIEVAGEPGPIGKWRTLDWMYEPGLHSPDELLPALLFSHGFSNGAVFWHVDCLSDFRIGKSTTRSGIQESLRLLWLKDPVYVSLEPTSVWRAQEPQKRFWERGPTIASFRRFALSGIGYLMSEKEKIDYQSLVIQRLGFDRVLGYIDKNGIADFAMFKQHRVARIERAMLLCGYNNNLTDRGLASRLGLLLMGYIARYLLPSWIPR
jgi:glycosyltransferase involved in cell wall biosynthesis